jgi:hypothetical protein
VAWVWGATSLAATNRVIARCLGDVPRASALSLICALLWDVKLSGEALAAGNRVIARCLCDVPRASALSLICALLWDVKLSG